MKSLSRFLTLKLRLPAWYAVSSRRLRHPEIFGASGAGADPKRTSFSS